jgi:hypothetical protein
MKVKMKFDLAAIKDWLLEHGEKVALGIVALVFVMFTWYAISRETLSAANAPEALKTKAASVKDHVSKSVFKADVEGVKPVDYTSRAKREMLVATAYPQPTPLKPLLADEKAKRDDPKLFPIEEPQVASGFSIFELRGKGKGDASLKAQPWVVVTALVPFKKQTQEYVRAFENAMGDKKSSAPDYTALVVERAVVDDSQPDKLDFKPLPDQAAIESQWDSKDFLVAEGYRDEKVLTAPLPPLAGGAKWDKIVAHAKIPLAGAPPPANKQADDAAKDAEKGAEKGADKGQDAPAAEPEANRRLVRQRPGDKPQSKPGETRRVEPAEIAYKLLRVFDYTVQPKKKYRYRVALAVANPNFGLPPHMLAKKESGAKEELETEPVETGAVVVPSGYLVLAASAAKGSRNDPAAKIMVSRIDQAEGIEPASEIEVWRGSLANFVAKDKLPVRLPGGGVKELDDVEIKTGTLVLDIHGGRPVTPKKEAVSPVEVLIMDSDGNISMRNELDDEGAVAHRRPPGGDSAKTSEPLERNDAPKAAVKARPKTGKSRASK